MILEAKNLPQYMEIKKLESISKKDGSGIGYEDLIGTWKFNSCLLYTSPSPRDH